MTDTYVCRACSRDVDADLEPSPGEPNYCQDCANDIKREEASA